MSVPSADALGWQVGTTRMVDVGDRSRHAVTLTGTFGAAPGSADHWELYTYAGTGELSLYMPGCAPAEIRSQVAWLVLRK